MELFCSISVWASSLSAHSRAVSGWALWGLWARGCLLFSGGLQGAPKPTLTRGRRTLCLQTGLGDQLAGAVFPQDRQDSGFWITGLQPGWEEHGCLSALAGRHCKREKWGRSRRFPCPAEGWLEVHLRGLRGERAPCTKRWVFSSISVRWSRGWPMMFFSVGGQFSCPCFFRRLSFPRGSFLVWFSWTDHVYVGSFLGSLFFPGVHVSVPHCGGYYRSVM